MPKVIDLPSQSPETVTDFKSVLGIDDFWNGKTVAWFGSSIPAGTDQGGRYPQQVADSLGFTVTNEAQAGSAFRAGVRSLVTGGDPYGWAGSPWPAVLWSLGMTTTEKQYLIDNWATIGPTLSGSGRPGTLDASYQSRAIAYCYENKLVANHLGANRKDVYVFDTPYNDLQMASDLMTDGTGGSRDRMTYQGVMNFLIDLILNDNPKARILFTGHYENALRPTLAQAQEAVATYWNRPLCRLWDMLGWNQQTITTTGYWQSNLWVESGGASQTITLLNRMLPDGTHPGNDYSGSAVARITEVMTPWFRTAR